MNYRKKKKNRKIPKVTESVQRKRLKVMEKKILKKNREGVVSLHLYILYMYLIYIYKKKSY